MSKKEKELTPAQLEKIAGGKPASGLSSSSRKGGSSSSSSTYRAPVQHHVSTWTSGSSGSSSTRS